MLDHSHLIIGRQSKATLFLGSLLLLLLLLFFFLSLCLSRAAITACGDSQARGPIRAVPASLHHSHSNAGFELCLRPSPQLIAMPDP